MRRSASTLVLDAAIPISTTLGRSIGAMMEVPRSTVLITADVSCTRHAYASSWG
jgi:hypothetical protein